MASNNSSGSNEMVDAKEAGKDAEETVVVAGEPAGNQSVELSVQEVQKDAAMEDAEIANPHNDMDSAAAPHVPVLIEFKAEDPTPPNLDANAKSIATLPNNQLSVEPTSDSKAYHNTDIQSSANGVLDGTVSIGFKSEDNDHRVFDGNSVCLDAKQPSATKSEQNENCYETKAESHQSKEFSAAIHKCFDTKAKADCKGKELKDVIPLNEKSLDTNAKDDKKGEELKELHLLNDKSSETKAKDDEKEDKLKELCLSNNKSSETKAEDGSKQEELKYGLSEMDLSTHSEIKKEEPKHRLDVVNEVALKTANKSFLFEHSSDEGYESGTEEEQAEFMKQVETFYRENNFEFKAPKFYKEELNLLKLWRAVIKLGGYEQVTSCKLWRQVGESFRPPKTCTTVSWTFRIFYEKALLEYEKHKIRNGELSICDGLTESIVRAEDQVGGSQAVGSVRRRRDAATRAMEGWHSQRLLGNGQVCHPIIKDKSLSSVPRSEKQLKTNGLLKRKKQSTTEHAMHISNVKTMKQQGDTMVIDIGPPADWVKINVQRTVETLDSIQSDCFEIYALVPGLLREEVHVQSDPAGRLIISGQPEQLDNPWGVIPFKKVVSLPSRIDPHQTSAVVTLHGQLFVRVPFEQSDL